MNRPPLRRPAPAWSEAEYAVLDARFPTMGAVALAESGLLPGRTAGSIAVFARRRGLHVTPETRRRIRQAAALQCVRRMRDGDPLPEEIAARTAEIRATWVLPEGARQREPRVYRVRW